MPKYTFKPICNLSKHTKRQRERNKLLLQTTRIDDTNDSIVLKHNTSFEIASVQLTQHDSNTLVPENISPTDMIQNSLILEVESNSNETNNNNSLITFQKKLASFIVSSRLARKNATELLKLLKSVDDLNCLKSLPTDSRTLLSTPRSNDINIMSVIGGQYIHFGILNGLNYLYSRYRP